MAEICPGGREGKTLRERKDTRNWGPAQGLRAASEAWGSAVSSEVGAPHLQEDNFEAGKNLAGNTALTPLLAVLESKKL